MRAQLPDYVAPGASSYHWLPVGYVEKLTGDLTNFTLPAPVYGSQISLYSFMTDTALTFDEIVVYGYIPGMGLTCVNTNLRIIYHNVPTMFLHKSCAVFAMLSQHS